MPAVGFLRELFIKPFIGKEGRTDQGVNHERVNAHLRDAIRTALEDGSLTYREITGRVDQERLYRPKDGTMGDLAQMGAVVRESRSWALGPKKRASSLTTPVEQV